MPAGPPYSRRGYDRYTLKKLIQRFAGAKKKKEKERKKEEEERNLYKNRAQS